MKNQEAIYYAEGIEMLMKNRLSFLAGFQKMELIKLKRFFEMKLSDIQAAREQVVSTHAERDKNGSFIFVSDGVVKIKKDEISKCNNAIKELMETEFEMEIKKSPIRIPQMNDLEPQALDILMLLADDPERVFI